MSASVIVGTGLGLLLALAIAGPVAALVGLMFVAVWVAATRLGLFSPAVPEAVGPEPIRQQTRPSQPFINDSGRQHGIAPTQTWAAFLTETYRKQWNSGAYVKLGRGPDAVGIVGESFHLPELQWLRSEDLATGRHRTRFLAYLIPEPENPYSR